MGGERWGNMEQIVDEASVLYRVKRPSGEKGES